MDLRIANVDGKLSVDTGRAQTQGFCGVSVASGLVLLGAAALATLAFATAGAGGAIIAGHVFTTSQIWAAAGLRRLGRVADLGRRAHLPMIGTVVVVSVFVVASAIVSFALMTKGIRSGRIRRAPRLSVARACTAVIAREAEENK